MSSNFAIFIAAHKRVEAPSELPYHVIQVGASSSTEVFGDFQDNSGNHISEMNPYFCELTALYWIWKNATADVVGLVHYRRFFSGSSDVVKFKENKIISKKEVSTILKTCSLIVPSSMGFATDGVPLSVEQQYFNTSIGQDLFLARKAIKMVDRGYLEAFDFVMRNNQLYPFNMFIGYKRHVDMYCEWIFAVMSLLKEWIPYQSYSAYQARVFGFLSERLFSVWLVHNRGEIAISQRETIFIE